MNKVFRNQEHKMYRTPKGPVTNFDTVSFRHLFRDTPFMVYPKNSRDRQMVNDGNFQKHPQFFNEKIRAKFVIHPPSLMIEVFRDQKHKMFTYKILP